MVTAVAFNELGFTSFRSRLCRLGPLTSLPYGLSLLTAQTYPTD